MISLLRKKACSGSILNLARIPTKNCLADCLPKASAKGDDLITAVRAGKVLDVVIHPDFTTPMERKAFLSTWFNKFWHKEEGRLFFFAEHSEDLFCTKPPRKFISGDVCGEVSSKKSKRNRMHVSVRVGIE